MKALIFGASGQDGFYLSQLCQKNNIDVIGVTRNTATENVANYGFVKMLIEEHKPAFVFHLAANSTTKHSALFENHETISTGSLNILESVLEYSPDSRVFITGSGLQFKNKGLPISEKDEFQANNAYAISRIQSAYAARYYRTLGLKAFVGYLFHHESPLRKEHHVSKMISTAVKRIAKGSKEKIEIGNIKVRKEWAFAEDIAHGIFKLMNQDKEFEATIGTGIAYSIEDWLTVCFRTYQLNWRDHVKQKENFTPEYTFFVSDPSTIKSIGWEPKISFEQLAGIMLNSD